VPVASRTRSHATSARESAAPAGVPPGRRRHPAVGRLEQYAFLLPAVALVAGLMLYPFLRTLYLSFTDSDGLNPPTLVGLDNYISLAGDPIMLRALSNTLLWVVGTLVFPVGIGLLVAVLSFRFRGGAAYRLPFLLPYALSGTVVAIVWYFILREEGALNAFLGGVGLPDFRTRWLLEAPVNTLVMIAASTWQATGVSVILFLIGLQTIPPEPLEAARLDGAHGWSEFRYMTWPLLRPMTAVAVGISLVNSLKTFDVIWVMTQGGPGRNSETLAVTMFRETFLLFHYGYGAAVAVVLCVIVTLASWLYLRRQLRPT
jgi:ABC-type sugar transport system permease subunit